jgi:hypothetical protein
MENAPIAENLIDYLLANTDGFRFERLVQRLLEIREGETFVSLARMLHKQSDLKRLA